MRTLVVQSLDAAYYDAKRSGVVLDDVVAGGAAVAAAPGGGDTGECQGGSWRGVKTLLEEDHMDTLVSVGAQTGMETEPALAQHG